MPSAVRTLPRTGGSGQRLRSSSHDSFRSIALTLDRRERGNGEVRGSGRDGEKEKKKEGGE